MATLVEIQRRLVEIRDKGYIQTARKGPTGVGYTFEKVFGLDEDNLQIPDIGGRVEIKTTNKNNKKRCRFINNTFYF